MTQEKFIKALGEQVRKIRLEKKMTLYRLGKNTGKRQGDLTRLEKGKITPSLYYLAEIAKGLDIDLEELVKGLP